MDTQIISPFLNMQKYGKNNIISAHLPAPRIPQLGQDPGKASRLLQCAGKETPVPGWAGAGWPPPVLSPSILHLEHLEGLTPGLARLDNFSMLTYLLYPAL